MWFINQLKQEGGSNVGPHWFIIILIIIFVALCFLIPTISSFVKVLCNNFNTKVNNNNLNNGNQNEVNTSMGNTNAPTASRLVNINEIASAIDRTIDRKISAMSTQEVQVLRSDMREKERFKNEVKIEVLNEFVNQGNERNIAEQAITSILSTKSI